MAAFDTTLEVREGQSGRISFTLQDQDGAPVAKASLDSLTVDLYNFNDGEVINDRDHQSILDVNGGAMHATTGVVTFDFTPDDTPFIGADVATSRGQEEWHVAHFRAVWDGGARSQGHEVLMKVRNFRRFAP